MEILDSSIAILFILFVLSQISERLTNIVKLWLHDNFRVGNLRLKPEGIVNNLTVNDQEKIREKKITTIAIIVGVLLALLIKADLNEILRIAIKVPSKVNTGDPQTITKLFSGWNAGEFNLKTVLGCILTGVFLSFGSKWWHDLIDLLMQVKNIRRNIAEKK